MADTPQNPSTPNQSLSERVRSLRIGDKTGPGQQPSRLRYLPWVVATVLLLTTAAFGYRAYRVDKALKDLESGERVSDKKKADTGYQGTEPGDEPADTIPADQVVLQSKGYVVPISLIQVSPKVGGQLVWIADNFKEGAMFKAGDVLARIEDVDYRSERDQAKATFEMAGQRFTETKKSMPIEIKQAEADLDETRQNATMMKLEMERNRRLRATNTVAQKEYEQAQYNYTSMSARIRRLQAGLSLIQDGRHETRVKAAEWEVGQAKAVLAKAQWRLDNTEIKAPISGTILSKKAELGNLVNPSAFSSGISASLCEMANLRELEIDLSVQERDIAQVKKDQPCWVMPEAYQGYREFLKAHPRGYEGFVSRIMPTADRAKGSIAVRVKISFIAEDEAGKYLRPEMGALVSFLKGPAPKKQARR